LYDQLDRADAAPTPAQLKATTELAGNFASAMRRWQVILDTDLPALNEQLKAANQPNIQIEAHPESGEIPQGDEE
ncbi:MAG: hypothetical protein WA734_05950, partial [Candidatus Acidiferrales bacterium]